MTALRISQAGLDTAKSEIRSARIDASSLAVCYDPIGVFGDEAVGALVARVQQLVSTASESLDTVTSSQASAVQTIGDSMSTADDRLAQAAS